MKQLHKALGTALLACIFLLTTAVTVFALEDSDLRAQSREESTSAPVEPSSLPEAAGPASRGESQGGEGDSPRSSSGVAHSEFSSDVNPEVEQEVAQGHTDAVQGRAPVAAESFQANSEATLLDALGQLTGEGTILITGSFSVSDTVTIQLGQDVTLRGAGANNTITVQGQQGNRHIHVLGGLTLENITLDGQDKGGGIGVSGGELALNGGALITKCRTEFFGGAVALTNQSTMEMDGGEISYSQTNLTGTAHGGGVTVNSSTLTLHSGRIQYNRSVWGGGVGIVGTGQFIMEGGFINNNTTSIEGGGGVMVDGQGSFALNNGTIEDNTASGQGMGGGVYVGTSSSLPTKPSFVQSGGTIQRNSAYVGGGVAATWYSRVEIRDGIINNNQAQAGGGISVVNTFDAMQLTLLDGEIGHNQALSSVGGGVYATSTQPINIVIGDGQTGPNIHDNQTQASGGGLALYQQVSAEMYNGTIHRNKAPSGNGGGFLVQQGASLAVRGGTLSGNQAVNGGGIAALGSGTDASILGGILSGNTAQNGGGMYVADDATATLRGNTRLQGNSASQSGGGIYTDSYDYSNPVATTAYQNIQLEKTVVFDQNTSVQAHRPPQNADLLPNLAYTQTSLAKSPGWLHPLNNYDINYAGTPAATIVSVAYHANGGTGGISRSELQGEQHIVLTHTAAGISRSGYTFSGWNTRQDGGGTGYSVGQTITLQGDITLYGQWRPSQGPTSPGTGTSSRSSSSQPPANVTESSSSSSSSRPAGGRASTSAVSSSSRPSSSGPVSPSSSIVSGPSAPDGGSDHTPEQAQTTFRIGSFTSRDTWSVLNLILAILAVLGGALALIFHLRRGDGEYSEGRRRSRIWLVALALGVLPITLFLVLERTSLPMALLSRWTPLLLAAFLAHLTVWIVAAVRSRRG